MTSLVVCGFLIFVTAALLFTERVDENLERRHPSYGAAWARVFGEVPDQPVHIQSISPIPCLVCGARGWHLEGCGYLDRRDAGMAS